MPAWRNLRDWRRINRKQADEMRRHPIKLSQTIGFRSENANLIDGTGEIKRIEARASPAVSIDAHAP